MSDYQARFDRLAGKIIDFRLRPPTGPYRTFFTPNVVGNVNRILGHSVPRSYAISSAWNAATARTASVSASSWAPSRR